MREDIKKILENKCDLIVQEREVDNNLLKHWKLAGIIKADIRQITYYSTSLKVILESGNIMWTEKFQLALISSNIFDEIMVLINPSESDFYALTDYEDIISLLETEFVLPYLDSERPFLDVVGNYGAYDIDMTPVDNLKLNWESYNLIAGEISDRLTSTDSVTKNSYYTSFKIKN